MKRSGTILCVIGAVLSAAVMMFSAGQGRGRTSDHLVNLGITVFTIAIAFVALGLAVLWIAKKMENKNSKTLPTKSDATK